MKPMLAVAVDVESFEFAFPLLVTPKIDGIRALKLNGKMVSRSLKPIQNAQVSAALESLLPDGADGELVYGDTFQSCTSAIMTRRKATDAALPGTYTYYWFDMASPDVPYSSRIESIISYDHEFMHEGTRVRIVPLKPSWVKDRVELENHERRAVDEGFEGLIIRKPDGPYKYGRSTLKESYMLKLKRFMDAEARVVGVEELQHNLNDAHVDALGYCKRSSHAENKAPAGKLGALVVEADGGGACVFKIGTGFDDAQRIDLWERREQIVGSVVKYKYFAHGVKTAPRHPVFLGFRHRDDI